MNATGSLISTSGASTAAAPVSDPSIGELLRRARRAQEQAASWSQQRTDEVVTAVAWTAYQKDNARRAAETAVAETGLGRVDHQIKRQRHRILGTLRDLHGVRTVGIVDRDPRSGLAKVPKPVGVIATMVPATSPTAAVAVNSLVMLKTRNAVIFCPNPRARRASIKALAALRQTLCRLGEPEDLLQIVERPSRDLAVELMDAADLVIAAGGTSAVKRASRSATPSYGAGVGNATVIVDETASIEAAARKIAAGKTFDYGTSCSSESCVVVQRSKWDETIAALRDRGGHLCDDAERQRLRRALWPDDRTLDRSLVGRPATALAEAAAITVPETTSFLIVEGRQIGGEDPFFREKLCPVLALWSYAEFPEAVELVNRLTDAGGPGHSCGIHTANDSHVETLALACRVSRLLVNQSLGLGNSGSFENGMPFSMILGCGTWGGNISSENLTWRHCLNYTWLSTPVEGREPDADELFADHWRRYGRE